MPHLATAAQLQSISNSQLTCCFHKQQSIIVTNSRILLLDEPFGALDVRTRLQMQDSLIRIHRNLTSQGKDPTILFVTHDIDEAVYLADDIYILGKAPAQIHKHNFTFLV